MGPHRLMRRNSGISFSLKVPYERYSTHLRDPSTQLPHLCSSTPICCGPELISKSPSSPSRLAARGHERPACRVSGCCVSTLTTCLFVSLQVSRSSFFLRSWNCTAGRLAPLFCTKDYMSFKRPCPRKSPASFHGSGPGKGKAWSQGCRECL